MHEASRAQDVCWAYRTCGQVVQLSGFGERTVVHERPPDRAGSIGGPFKMVETQLAGDASVSRPPSCAASVPTDRRLLSTSPV